MALDFSQDNKADLDAYGVWVKKPPQNIEQQPQMTDSAETQPAQQEIIDVSLDDFLDDDIPVDTTDPVEQESETEEPVLDIDLTFDDDFTAQAGAVLSDTDQIENMDSTPDDESETNLDDLFDNIEEINTSSNETTTETDNNNIEFNEISDFDDVLNDINDVVITDDNQKEKDQTIVDYNLSVEEDNPSAPEKEFQTESTDESEDVDISVVGTLDFDNTKDSEKERLSIEPEDSDFDPEIVFEQTEDFSIDQPSGSDDASGADSIPEEEQDFDMEKNKEFVAKTEQMLERIISELTSLKGEVGQLRADVDSIKQQGTDTPAPTQKIPPAEEQQITETTAANGFFGSDLSSDGDDTIALSGDELNNILESANFVEEFAGDTDTEVPSDSDLDFDTENISDDELFVPADENDIFDDTDSNIEHEIKENSAETIEEPDSNISEDIILPPVEENIIEEDVEDESADIDIEPEESIDDDIVIATDDNVPEIIPETDLDMQDVDTSDYGLTNDNLDYLSQEPTAEETLSGEQSEISIQEAHNFLESVEKESEFPDTTNESNDTDTSRLNAIPAELRDEIKSVLSYIDQLLENLPEDKIAEFAKSEHFKLYKQLFSELGLS